MQLHKLSHYAHGRHLGLKETPLWNETLEAWRYGSVASSIYREFRSLGADPISRLATAFDPSAPDYFSTPEVSDSDAFVRSLLERVWKACGSYSAATLFGPTHAPGPPRRVTKECDPGMLRAGIPNDLIQSRFKRRIKRNRDES